MVTLAGGAEIGSACADRLDFLTVCGRLPHGMPAMGSARKLLGLGQWNTRGTHTAMDAVKIEGDGSIRLPKEVLRRFPKRSQLAVWAEGDVIVLKRLRPAKLSAIAARRPEKEMPLAEIDAEVQAHRKAKRARKA